MKVLLSWSRHELTNHLDRVTEIWFGDSQVYEASDYLSVPRRGSHSFPESGQSLTVLSRGVKMDLQSAIPNMKSILNT